MESPHPTTAPTTNGLGIAGFVCSLLGILGSCGLLSPIGLILSLVAVGRQPRGFAIAGIVIGALGTCFVAAIVAISLAVPALFIAALAGLGVAGALGPGFLDKVEMAQIASVVEDFRIDHGFLPMSLKELTLDGDDEDLADRWGQPYQYELAPNGMTYRVFSMGPDGIAGTADDITANPDWTLRFDPSEWDEDESSDSAPAPADTGSPPASSAE